MKGELAVDPRGLIWEAYRMELGPEDCRAIFFDWALGHPVAVGREEVAALLDHYGPGHPEHPMTAVLREGMEALPEGPRRRKARDRFVSRVK